MNRRRRIVRLAVAAIVAFAALWFCIGWVVIVSPTYDTLQKADAIVVLGGPDVDGRADYGLQLAAAGYAPVVVVSAVTQSAFSRHKLCGKAADPQVLCFSPKPTTTQGEAREIGDLVAERRWTKVIVVTSSYHISRARMIINRCYGGQLIMTAPPDHPHSPLKIAYEYAYQSAAYIKALAFKTEC